jgi:hypothetical protein
MATPAVADHIRRRGVFSTQQLSGLQDQAILQVAMAGANAKTPYYPWRVSPDSPIGNNIVWQHREVADYCLARTRVQAELRNNANRSGMTTANTDIHPTLISPVEMARRGWLTSPTAAEIYTAQGVSQEQHDEKSIAAQTGRGPPASKHRKRYDYGGADTTVDDI